MRNVAELLPESTATEHQDNYVVLVVDGKTYSHLVNIKHLYGPVLQKLLIFPGDWHTLANFQPVLALAFFVVHYPVRMHEGKVISCVIVVIHKNSPDIKIYAS